MTKEAASKYIWIPATAERQQTGPTDSRNHEEIVRLTYIFSLKYFSFSTFVKVKINKTQELHMTLNLLGE